MVAVWSASAAAVPACAEGRKSLETLELVPRNASLEMKRGWIKVHPAPEVMSIGMVLIRALRIQMAVAGARMKRMLAPATEART